MLAGVPSAESLSMALDFDPVVLEPGDATAAAIGCELGMRLLAARQLAFLASAADGRRREKGDLSGPGLELAAATGLHPTTGSCRTDLACSVISRLPVTLQLLEQGVLRLKHVEDIERATRELTDEQARHIDATAVRPGPTGLARRIAEALAKLDPDRLEKKAERADTGRDVTFWTDGIAGTAGIEALGPVDKVAQIKAALDSLARTKTPDDPRGLGARRFDVLYDWARTVLGLPRHDPDGEPRPPAAGACDTCGRCGPSTVPINVSISLEALLHLSEAPGDLDGTPIPAEVARQLAADGRWRRFVVEPPTGRLLDVGAHTYRPTDALLRFVRGRNRTCIFPGCTRRAADCDCDHTRAFHTEGGPTTAANLSPLCRTHHRCKHELHWTYRRQPDDTIRWTAPSGRTYTTEPDHYADDPTLTNYLTATSRRRRERERKEEAKRRKPDPANPATEPDPNDQPPF